MAVYPITVMNRPSGILAFSLAVVAASLLPGRAAEAFEASPSPLCVEAPVDARGTRARTPPELRAIRPGSPASGAPGGFAAEDRLEDGAHDVDLEGEPPGHAAHHPGGTASAGPSTPLALSSPGSDGFLRFLHQCPTCAAMPPPGPRP